MLTFQGILSLCVKPFTLSLVLIILKLGSLQTQEKAIGEYQAAQFSRMLNGTYGGVRGRESK